jgi:hypothetical protein
VYIPQKTITPYQKKKYQEEKEKRRDEKECYDR